MKRLPKTWNQRCHCPDAQYWAVGDVVMIGKGSRCSVFVIVGRISATVVSMRFKREMKEAPENR